ncbi:MAG TPA: helix-turn-helix domain-containing protein [Mycobacterium sp.]|nr:helix-turn-helix domain-containing protein [Mycobacterium sp.]
MATTTSGVVADTLRREFEALGLSPYEARVQLALLTLGSGTPGELARVADVPRTSTYQILEELRLKGLAARLPGEGRAVWSSRSRDEVLGRLEAVEEERLHRHRARAARVRDMLNEAFPEIAPPALPYVHVIHDPALARPFYEQLVRDTQSELLVFNKPPYSWTIGEPNPVVVEAARRARCRALYQSKQADEGTDGDWRNEMEGYHAAGVEGRVVDELPIKLAVADRKMALLSLAHPTLANVGFPTFVVVEHPGFASVQADAFEHVWQSARPYVSSAARSAKSSAPRPRSSRVS